MTATKDPKWGTYPGTPGPGAGAQPVQEVPQAQPEDRLYRWYQAEVPVPALSFQLQPEDEEWAWVGPAREPGPRPPLPRPTLSAASRQVRLGWVSGRFPNSPARPRLPAPPQLPPQPCGPPPRPFPPIAPRPTARIGCRLPNQESRRETGVSVGHAGSRRHWGRACAVDVWRSLAGAVRCPGGASAFEDAGDQGHTAG